MKYIINHRFTSLNAYVNAERSNRYRGAAIKKQETQIAYLTLKGKPKLTTPCTLRFDWYVKDKKTDADNICFSKKFILDAMIKANIIPDDNLKHIIGFEDNIIIDKHERVEIEAIE